MLQLFPHNLHLNTTQFNIATVHIIQKVKILLKLYTPEHLVESTNDSAHTNVKNEHRYDGKSF